MTAQTSIDAPVAGADITAENTWTGDLSLGAGARMATLAVDGTFVGTVTLQMRRPDQGEGDYKDLYTCSNTDSVADRHVSADIIGPAVVRAGIKTGEFTSGTAEVEVAVANR